MALDLLKKIVSAQYLENKRTDLTKLYITVDTDKINIGIVTCHFLHICTSVIALDLREKKWTEFHQKFYICIHIDKIYVGIVTHHFSHICT